MLINLALAEFLIAFVGVPMDVLPLLHDKWVPEKDLCITTGTIVTTTGIAILIPTPFYYENGKNIKHLFSHR